eukprot:45247-Prymnesium_polylepis.1
MGQYVTLRLPGKERQLVLAEMAVYHHFGIRSTPAGTCGARGSTSIHPLTFRALDRHDCYVAGPAAVAALAAGSFAATAVAVTRVALAAARAPPRQRRGCGRPHARARDPSPPPPLPAAGVRDWDRRGLCRLPRARRPRVAPPPPTP